MNIHYPSFPWFIYLFIALIPLVSCNEQGRNHTEKYSGSICPPVIKIGQDSNLHALSDRESITFILGEDKSMENPYYAEATRYFKVNGPDKPTYLILHCRSLAEVHQYLQEHSPANGLPWGKIHLVSHGDQWLGLSVKVSPDSRRTTREGLEEYIHNPAFRPLPDNLIDTESEIAIHACGVGNNASLVQSIARFFESNHSLPQVIAPRLFEFYGSAIAPDSSSYCEHFVTRAWMVSFPRMNKPGILSVCNLFHNKYGNEKIDWQEALSRKKFSKAGEVYTYEFDIPVHVVINLSQTDTFPARITQEAKLNWLNQQPQIQHILSQIQLPAESFSWELQKGFAKGPDGKRTLAIAVKGYATMVCVLKPLVSNKPTPAGQLRPFVPEYTDTAYYYLAGGAPITIKS